jgi:hypothetical protein
MTPTPSNVARDEDLLCRLAMTFRRTPNPMERRRIAREYADAVDRLIQSGHWQQAPSPEEQLPHDFMPTAFFEFWTQGQNDAAGSLPGHPVQGRYHCQTIDL